MLNLFRRSRSRIWYVSFVDASGVRKQMSCRTTDRRLAKRFALTLVASNVQRAAPSAPSQPASILPSPPSLLISEFADAYLDIVAGTLTRKTVGTIRDSFRSLIRFTGDKPLSSLTLEECERFIRTAHRTAYSARKHYGHLRSAFEKARMWGRINVNPFLAVDKPKARETQMSYFTHEDFSTLIGAMPRATFAQKRLVNMTTIAYETGLRLGEIQYLRLASIDRVTRVVNVVNTSDFTTKSKRHRQVPLTTMALKAIDDQLLSINSHRRSLVRATPYLFPNEAGLPVCQSTIGNPFVKACTLALGDRRGLSFHSLRHSFGCRLGLAGVPVQMIQRLLGHQSVGVTQRYMHWEHLDYAPALHALEASNISTSD